MTKVQIKKAIDKEIRAMRVRITDIVRNRIADQILDDLSDETGELMGKLTVDFVDGEKLTDYAYGKIYDALLGAFMPGDIMVKGETIINDFYIEMKNCEQWKLLEWYKKAREESLDLGLSKIPIIDVTRNLEEHFIFIRRDHFVKIMRELEGYRNSDSQRSTDRQINNQI